MKRLTFVTASALAICGATFKAAWASGSLALIVDALDGILSVGTDPTIRIRLRNGGMTSIFFHNYYAWELVDIEIRDDRGVPLKQGNKPASPPSSHAAMVTVELKPAAELTLHGLTRESGVSQMGLPLSRWGYSVTTSGAMNLTVSAARAFVEDLTPSKMSDVTKTESCVYVKAGSTVLNIR